MKNKNIKKTFWRDVPDELRYLCMANVLKGSADYYCSGAILNYLIEHMNITACDSFIYDTSPYDVINWIDKAFETCLFPLEIHEKEWKKHSKEIEQILSRSEELLQRLGPPDYKIGYVTQYNDESNVDIIGWSQKLNVYYSVYYLYTEQWNKLEFRLQLLLENTKRNLKQMILFNEIENYTSEVEWTDYHYWGMDRIEPINWLYREYLPAGSSRKIYTRILENYALFLDDMRKNSSNSSAWSILHKRAEKKLQKICELVLDDIYDNLEDSDNTENAKLISENELYESIFNNSKERISY